MGRAETRPFHIYGNRERKNMNNKAMKKYFPVFVLLTLIAFTIGFIVPFCMGVYLSFCKFTTVTDAKFVGFSNYAKIFRKDGTFRFMRSGIRLLAQ